MDDEDLSSYAGPTPWCNWVLKGQVLAGGYPASMDDEENDALLLMLMRDVGIDCFVCLQSEVSERERRGCVPVFCFFVYPVVQVLVQVKCSPPLSALRFSFFLPSLSER